MKEFGGKTAVVTGAGSGIGRSLALSAATRGMNTVLADINERDLAAVTEEVERVGVGALAVPTDVGRVEALAHLAEASKERFGAVHLLFNNAGVSSAPDLLWETELRDWNWVVDINLQSVFYGVKAFVPGMLEHGEKAHVVNTASIAGLISTSRMNAYGVTKHAVVALSETLLLDLQEVNAPISVSVLCPAWVKTNIHTSERNRPQAERTDPNALRKGTQETAGAVMKLVESGLEPADVAEAVFAAVETDTFYILTHPPFNSLIERRGQNILKGEAPQGSWGSA